MPRKQSQPAYRLHKARNCAVVTIDGRNYYLGPFDSPESHEAYARLIAEWKLRQAENAVDPRPRPSAALSVNELLLRYLDFAETYYVDSDGKTAQEFTEIKRAVGYVKDLYGSTPAREFGPLALKALRQHLVECDLSRKVINQRIDRIKRVWKWAVSEELLPAGAYEALRTVAGLRYGRTTARETEPVRPANEHSVAAVLKIVAPQVAALIRIQKLAGMRPEEAVAMRLADIDRSDDVWVYEPPKHKSAFRGHRRAIQLGPQAQKCLEPFLDRPAESFLFSPIEADQWYQHQKFGQTSPQRKTPVYPCELQARARRKIDRAERPKKRKRPLRDRYDVASYRRAITRAIKRAQRDDKSVQHWHPNQLRHSRATEIRKRYGIEAAQVSLGHARADVTQIYAERDLDLARRVALELG